MRSDLNEVIRNLQNNLGVAKSMKLRYAQMWIGSALDTLEDEDPKDIFMEIKKIKKSISSANGDKNRVVSSLGKYWAYEYLKGGVFDYKNGKSNTRK